MHAGLPRLNKPISRRSIGTLRLCASAFFLAAFLSYPSGSQAAPWNGASFEQLSNEQGLSQPTVSCLLQDSLGYLWIGTQNGLNRYDGYGVEVFFQESGKLSHDWITSLVEDSSGDFWIGSEGGIARWGRRSGEVSFFRHEPANTMSLSSDRVRFLSFDHDGMLWVGTDDSGLNRLDPSTGRVARFRHDPMNPGSLSNDHLRVILEDREGRLWIGTLAGLNRFDRETGSFFRVPLSLEDDPDLPPLEVRALFQDRQGDLWVGTQLGLIRYQPSTEERQIFRHSPDPASLSHDMVRAVFEDSEGRLWVGTAGGLNLRPEPGSPFVGFDSDTSNPNSIGSDQVSAILEDRSGNLWFGTLTGGAFKWNPRSLSFEHLKEGQGNEDNQRNLVFAISEDRDRHLWTGSWGGGLIEQSRQTGERTHHVHDPEDPSSLSEDRVMALLHDSHERLWVGTMAKGLNLLEPDGRRFRHFRHDPNVPDSLSSDSITSLAEDEKSQLWIGTFGSGINQFLGNGRFERFTSSGAEGLALSSDRVFALEPDAHGRIWIATDGGGLNLLDPERKRIYHWRHQDTVASSLSSDELYSLHIDETGRLWIGSKNHGLDLLESIDLSRSSATFRQFNLTDRATSNTIWGIESDTKGRIWLSTSNGLVRLEPESESVRRYDTSHGLQSMEFNLGAHFRSPSGELFFGGVNGLNAFFPEQVRDNTVPPPVVLTDFHVLNQPVDVGQPLAAVQELVLDHDDHFLAFEFAALDFTAPEKNRYRYQLEGFEDRWVDLKTDRTVSFTSLNPGKFVLRVQGSNSDGVWSEPGASLALTVAPPLWRTWWFRSLLLLFAAATATLAHQLRIRRIRYNNERLHELVKERTRDLEQAQERLVRKEKLAVLGELSGSVAHELRNPLGIIKNSVFFLRLTQKLVDDKAKEHLALIEREIKRSDRIIGELLDYAKEPTAQTERTSVRSLIDSSLENVDIPDAIELIVDLEVDGREPKDVEVDPGQIERVLGNLLSNAAQAMPEGGTLTVDCKTLETESWIRVRDTGVGIEDEDLDKVFEPLFTRKIYGIGLGLPLSLRYVRMNGGRLECESRVGEGTTFHLYLPLAAD